MLDFSDGTTVQAATALGVFDRIVCGVDESPEALEAARQAERLRSPDGLLRVAAVTDVDTAVHAGFAMSHVLTQLDESAHAALHRAIATVRPGSSHILAGSPARCLLDAVERYDATLVAAGPHGHSRALGALLGGVSATLLHEAPCSVLLARRPRFGRFPSSILVGVDGSEHSLAAAAVGMELAERFGSELCLVAATGGKAVDLAPVRELTPFFVQDPGRPVDALTELSREADLLVLGSRGLHGLTSLGSVSERVAHKALCSVLVVRPTTETTSGGSS
jgi:nucleotide-binding universal stress UspA family protein